MIDIHSHILWGIDDGSVDLEMSEKMAKIAIKNGITHIIATPHFKTSKKNITNANEVRAKVKELNEYLLKKKIKLTIYTGMELYASNDILELLIEGKALTLAKSRYVLVDFSLRDIPYFLYDLVYRLILDGYIPIIAHPERNKAISNDINIVRKLIQMGAYIQIDKGSLIGEFGDTAKKTAIKLLSYGLVNCVATDMHNIDKRNPILDGLMEELSKIVDHTQINVLVNENPKRILDNRENLISVGGGNEKQKSTNSSLKKSLLISIVVFLIIVGNYILYKLY